mmetsp:Transcript_14292/g.22184  ORF Transcript_14292/g.22184 Transcript_14292/m.22184 type:complete len:114 (-) Transcript_14292:1073-1414(-)
MRLIWAVADLDKLEALESSISSSSVTRFGTHHQADVQGKLFLGCVHLGTFCHELAVPPPRAQDEQRTHSETLKKAMAQAKEQRQRLMAEETARSGRVSCSFHKEMQAGLRAKA